MSSGDIIKLPEDVRKNEIVLTGSTPREAPELDEAATLLLPGVRKAIVRLESKPGPGGIGQHGSLRPDGVQLDVTTGELSRKDPPKQEPEPEPTPEPSGPDVSEAQSIIRRFTRELRAALSA